MTTILIVHKIPLLIFFVFKFLPTLVGFQLPRFVCCRFTLAGNGFGLGEGGGFHHKC
jgi:hypothetical protein